ncbi:glutaminase A [Pseudonocardia hispaniensis]|uniref:glutaminase n=1 Tax=Pseudonocardia hispaniensis TaxID=904933 RepID=A0ABW1IZ42_9PSEU
MNLTRPYAAAGESPYEVRPSLLREYSERAVSRGRAAAADGRVTAQVPALGLVPPTKFAFVVATVHGDVVAVGDADEPFSLQSVTKLYSLCALLARDPFAWDHVGWGTTEAGYGSVAELELRAGQPRNPFVNAGALVVTDRLLSCTGDAVQATRDLIAGPSGECVLSDSHVAASEAHADHRNHAIAHVLAEHRRLQNPIDEVLDQYFAQCAIAASARTVAASALFLAERNRAAGPLDPSMSRRVNAVLLISGMYGAAAEIAYRIGLPAKSGIGGGIVAVLPGVGTVCVWSPPLGVDGNPVGGIAALEEFSRLAGWTVF